MAVETRAGQPMALFFFFLGVFAVAAAITPALPSPAPGKAAGRAPRKSVPVLKRVVVSRPAGRNS